MSIEKGAIVVAFPVRERVVLEPDLQEFQHLGSGEVKAVADRFFRYAKQLYKLVDIRRADELWGDEHARTAAQHWPREQELAE